MFWAAPTTEQIQVELGLSSKTVAKALLRPEEILDGYQGSAASLKPVIDPVAQRIEDLLRGSPDTYVGSSHGTRGRPKSTGSVRAMVSEGPCSVLAVHRGLC